MSKRGQPTKHDFSRMTLGKPRLFKDTKIVNGIPVNLTSLYICARRWAKLRGMEVSKETVSNGIKLTFKVSDVL